MAALRKTIGIIRLFVGALFLAAPGPGSRLFLIPFTPEASLANRLFGTRAIVLGALFYRANEPEEGRKLYQQALAIDSLDLIATAVSYIEGHLDLIPAVTTVGGVVLLFLVLNLVGLNQKRKSEV